MSFVQAIRMPLERVGVLVGKGGSVKSVIEERCFVTLRIDSPTGEVQVNGRGDPEKEEVFRAANIVTAIGRGFSPARAYRLLGEDVTLDVVDLKPYAGKSEAAVARVKGRIIGLNGKARRVIEGLTGADVSVYGRTVGIIGRVDEVRLAKDAITSLASGSSHSAVYKRLEKARAAAKVERLKLWEDA